MCSIRFLPILILLPVVAAASIGYDIISIDPEEAAAQGFEVQVVSERPYLRITVTYPDEINDVWSASYAVVGYWDPTGKIRFFVRTSLGKLGTEPVHFTLVEEPGTSDASVDIHYVCVSEDPDICDKGAEALYHMKSMRAYR